MPKEVYKRIIAGNTGIATYTNRVIYAYTENTHVFEFVVVIENAQIWARE